MHFHNFEMRREKEKERRVKETSLCLENGSEVTRSLVSIVKFVPLDSELPFDGLPLMLQVKRSLAIQR